MEKRKVSKMREFGLTYPGKAEDGLDDEEEGEEAY